MIGSALYDPVGGGLITVFGGSGPIVGDPEPTLGIAAGGYLTTGDLALGETGDAGDLEWFAVEMWFMSGQQSPAAQSSLAAGPLGNTGVRQWELFLNTDLTLTFSVRTSGSVTVSATSGASLVGGVFAHIVAQTRFNGANGVIEIYLNGLLSISNTAWAGSAVNIMGAIAGSEDMRISKSTNGVNFLYFSDVAFYRFGLPPDRVLAHYVAGSQRGWLSQSSGARVIGALDSVSSTAPRRIGTGVRSVTPKYMNGQAPLDEMRAAVAGEAVDAALFTAADGTVVYLDSAHRSSSPYNTVQVTFDDDGTDIPYSDATVDYSESFLANEWNVTREGNSTVPGQTQTASDATSISRYFKRSQSLTGLPVTTDGDASTIAAAMLAKYKDPMFRITGISFDTVDPNVTEAILRRELMDKIRVFRTPPGGGARIDQSLFIQKIEISGANDGKPWSIRWGVSPL
jgi:Concanavalin A-like lectin/glucanases superfamily